MIEESGRVISIDSDGVLVETIRQSACGSCSAAKGCGQKMLASVGQGQRFEVLAENPRNLILHTGDQVMLGLQEQAFLKASAFAYLLPLLTMIAAALMAEVFVTSDIWVAFAGFSGLAGGLLILRWRFKLGRDHCQFSPEILRTLGSDKTVHF
ncbi:MAG: SoxR reducing system RseC family protein [Motiliproteus sp.]|nr:SoxR reducing system RseC family protein [Motiliproteus sp.]MCW9050704.1 SoxR reducing system RseC family protein [Motiliproteus sp.]